MHGMVLEQKNHKLIIFIFFAVYIQKVSFCSLNIFLKKSLSSAVLSLAQAEINVGVNSHFGYETLMI